MTVLLILAPGCGNNVRNSNVVSSEITVAVIPADTVTADHRSSMLEDVTAKSSTEFACSYEGIKHDYIMDFPAVIEGAPLILMLPGYGSSAKGFRLDTAFHQEANARGYTVAYVSGAPTPEDSTSASGWNSGIGISAKNDVDFLCALANYLCKIYALDSTRVFAAGFSNGAFMTHRLALEAHDTFTAVVSVAGMMPESIWNERPENCQIGVFQITGEKDNAIPKNSDGSAKFSKAPAIEDVIEYYVQANSLTLSDTETIEKNALLEKYTSLNSTKQVWNLTIPNGYHSWPSEKLTGIKTNELILEFLDTQ